MFKPSWWNLRPISARWSFVRSLRPRNIVPFTWSFCPTAIWVFANAPEKSYSIPITSSLLHLRPNNDTALEFIEGDNLEFGFHFFVLEINALERIYH
jgi:hypothetical protein